MAAVELQDLKRLIDVRDLMITQVGHQPGPIELFLIPHVAVLGKRLMYVFEFLCHCQTSKMLLAHLRRAGFSILPALRGRLLAPYSAHLRHSRRAIVMR
jgi:hypothetical protein